MKDIDIHEKKNIDEFINLLSTETSFTGVLSFSESRYFEDKENIFLRLRDLIKMFKEEEEEDPSLESLKGLLTFLYSIKRFKEPSITIDDSGDFQISWKKDKDNLLTLIFLENYKMHVLNFKSGINKLDIDLRKESINGMAKI